jgi:hypothetical protein
MSLLPVVKSRATDPVLTMIAYHEAGHAVARFESGLAIKRITIVPEGESAGAVHARKGYGLEYLSGAFPLRPTPSERKRSLRNLIWVLGGPMADYIANPNRESLAGISLGEDDDWQMQMLTTYLLGPIAGEAKRVEFQSRMITKTFVLLSYCDVWAQVEALVDALFDRSPTLSGRVAKSVCMAAKHEHL